MSVHLTLRRPFVADHYHDLPTFQEARHGHNWELEATVTLARPEERTALAAALDAWVQQVDYALLNDQPALAGCNPTTEVLAHWAFDFLEGQGLNLDLVRVREKANYWAACHR